MSSAYQHQSPLLPSSRDIRNLVWSTLALRFLTILIAFLSSYLPLFDASPSLVSPDPDSPLLSRFASIAMRWDAFHYLTIARHGYRYEHQYAFMPGLPILLRILSHFGTWLSPSLLIATVIPHFVLSTLFSLDTTRLLYLLSLHQSGSRHLALLSSYLSLLPSSPSILHLLAPYTEPWFTWASYKGKNPLSHTSLFHFRQPIVFFYAYRHALLCPASMAQSSLPLLVCRLLPI